MKKVLKIVGICLLIGAAFLSILFKEGLVSNPIGQFTGFQIHHQHTGWGTSRYYPSIDPTVSATHPVTVAVIDSGIAEEAMEEFYIASLQTFSNDPSPYDRLGHGTKIASMIAAKDNHVLTLGLAPTARLYSYKVVDENGVIKNDYLVEAFHQAIQDEVAIVNLSMVLTNPSSELLDVMATYIKQGGYVVVPAYDLKDVTVQNPAMTVEGVIGVGSFNEWFTMIQEQKEVAYYAPYSQEALSLGQQIVRSEGSSFSAAFVSGAIANWLSQGYTHEEVETSLERFFSAATIRSKQSFLVTVYEDHQEWFNQLYMILGIATLILFVAYVVLEYWRIRQVREQKKRYVIELLITILLFFLLAVLLLPTQM